MRAALTDTKKKRLGVIVAVVVAIVAAIAYFNVHGSSLADRKASQVERAAEALVARVSYDEVSTFPVEDLTVDGVRPYVAGGVAGDFVVKWRVEKWGAGRCITAVWAVDDAPDVTRIDC